MEVPQALCPWGKKRVEEFSSSQDHDPTVVAAMDCGAYVTVSFSSSFGCVLEKARVLS